MKDTIIQVVGWMAFGFIMAALMWLYEQASQRAPVITSSGHQLLRLPRFIGAIGLIALIGGVGVIIYGLINFNEEDLLPQSLLFLMCAGLGMPLVLETWVAKIILTEDSIIRINMLGRKKQILWKDIQSIKYNSTTMELKLSSNTTKITCHRHLMGFYHLVKAILDKTPYTLEQLKIS